MLDISYNCFTSQTLSEECCRLFENNRSLEYLGLAKNGLTSADIAPMLEHFGRFPFPADQVAAHQAKLKERDAIVEANKKTKGKKPDVPVPVVDNLESKTSKDSEGNEITNWFLQKNPQFRHLNLCLNQLDEFAIPALEKTLSLTLDDFCFTLSGNSFSEEDIQQLEKCVKTLHKQRVKEQKIADPGTPVYEIADIEKRRVAF